MSRSPTPQLVPKPLSVQDLQFLKSLCQFQALPRDFSEILNLTDNIVEMYYPRTQCYQFLLQPQFAGVHNSLLLGGTLKSLILQELRSL
jgi:hypothetical protein